MRSSSLSSGPSWASDPTGGIPGKEGARFTRLLLVTLVVFIIGSSHQLTVALVHTVRRTVGGGKSEV